MQGKVVFVLMIATFCAGALIGRIYSVSTGSDPQIAALAVPMPPAPSQSASARVTAEHDAFTMENCLAGAKRRGVTYEQALYACDEIMN